MTQRRKRTTLDPKGNELLARFQQRALEAGIVPKTFLKQLTSASRATPDPIRALTAVDRFLTAGFGSSFLRDFASQPIVLEVFLRLSAQSQLLGDILVRSPELLRWLMTTNVLQRDRTREEYVSEATNAIALFERKEKRLNALKRFHRRELLRLGAREILEEASNDIVAAELAWLADAVVEAALRIALDDLQRQAGRTIDPGLAVIGLGKSGGEELNFSSDIDLMFVYDQDDELPSVVDGAHTVHALNVRIVESMVKMLTEHSEEGYLYRVDLRLRPDGNTGPVAMSRAAFLTYYEARGELWERQMLMKARVIAGSNSVGLSFLSDIRPFVFPRMHMRSPIEEIGAIKRKIEEKVGHAENVKLSAGGIRDIEFIVQALQMLNAGSNERLRIRGTLPALRELSEARLLSKRESADLQKAYAFLRLVEHRLQLLEGRQTHSLPESPEEFRMLSSRLGFPSAAKFRLILESHRQMVRKEYEKVFEPKAKRDPIKIRNRKKKEASSLTTDVWVPFLDRLERAVPGVDLPMIISAAKQLKSEAGRLALQRITEMAETETIRRTVGASISNPRFLSSFLRMSAYSRSLASLCMREPLFFESIVGNPQMLQQGSVGWEFLLESERSRFREFNEARTLFRFFQNQLEIQDVFGEVSQLADDIIVSSMSEAIAAFPKQAGNGLVLLAVGKAGGRELTIGSDLDLMFIDASEPSTRKPVSDEIPRHFLALVSETHPPAYRVDLRLRPEGKSSPLVSTLPYLRGYFDGRAQLWERQSLLRARPVFGSAEACVRLMKEIHTIAYERPLPVSWVEDIHAMRLRIERDRSSKAKNRQDLKTGSGGLLDVEFIVQGLQLVHGKNTPPVRTPSTLEALDALQREGFLPRSSAALLRKNYLWLRTLELFQRVNQDLIDFSWPMKSDLTNLAPAFLGAESVDQVSNLLDERRRENRALFEDTFSSLRK